MPKGSWTLDPTQPLVMQSDFNGDTVRVKVAPLIERLQKTVAAMPEEVRAEAYLQLDAFGGIDDHPASAQLYISRPATKAEQEAQERVELKASEARRLNAEAEERATYERLKAKFG
jgi:hypothetical protein